jgi:hypothetical protein
MRCYGPNCDCRDLGVLTELLHILNKKKGSGLGQVSFS